MDEKIEGDTLWKCRHCGMATQHGRREHLLAPGRVRECRSPVPQDARLFGGLYVDFELRRPCVYMLGAVIECEIIHAAGCKPAADAPGLLQDSRLARLYVQRPGRKESGHACTDDQTCWLGFHGGCVWVSAVKVHTLIDNSNFDQPEDLSYIPLMLDARFWKEQLNLRRHGEGGWYVETYRSSELLQPGALPARYSGPRPCSTAIYFLLEGREVSHFHRLLSDEVWHFYAGSGARIHILSPDGRYAMHRLGQQPVEGDQLQVAVSRGVWMAAEVTGAKGYALMGCTVAPGFDFADFEMGSRGILVAAFPEQRKLIERLTVQ